MFSICKWVPNWLCEFSPLPSVASFVSCPYFAGKREDWSERTKLEMLKRGEKDHQERSWESQFSSGERERERESSKIRCHREDMGNWWSGWVMALIDSSHEYNQRKFPSSRKRRWLRAEERVMRGKVDRKYQFNFRKLEIMNRNGWTDSREGREKMDEVFEYCSVEMINDTIAHFLEDRTEMCRSENVLENCSQKCWCN